LAAALDFREYTLPFEKPQEVGMPVMKIHPVEKIVLQIVRYGLFGPKDLVVYAVQHMLE
jgi:hypothetical protein